MSSFEIGKLAQVIHVTGDLAGADALYRNVFGGECFYEGYSPHEKRDASIIAIGDFVVEPMAPAAEEGAESMPVGRFHERFGDHLHSIALNVSGVPALYEHLREHDVRVVGPGGIDPTAQDDSGTISIYTHPKDSHCLLEFVDFRADVMPGSPRAQAHWDPMRWRDDHPLGIMGPSHVTVVVRDLDTATAFFADVLGCPPFHETSDSRHGTSSRFCLVGTETVVELAQPVGEGSRAAADLAANGEIVHRVTLQVQDPDAAVAHLDAHGVGVVERADEAILLDPAHCYGALIELTSATLPADPRQG